MRAKLTFIFAFCIYSLLNAQVGVFAEDPHPSSILEVRAHNDKGVMFPTLTTAEKLSISNPAEGLIVFDLDLKNYSLYDGNSWLDLAPVPSGTIIMWSGNTGDLPAGWVLCDGRSYDLSGAATNDPLAGRPTPNLRDRFVVGYDETNSEYDQPFADIGGEDSTRLQVQQMPLHSHEVTSVHNHNLLIGQSLHSHTITYFTASASMNNDTFMDVAGGVATNYFTGGTATYTAGLLFNTIATEKSFSGIAVDSRGSGGYHENRPPYYVLAFIMKL
jgi:microcystin-dependent protein